MDEGTVTTLTYGHCITLRVGRVEPEMWQVRLVTSADARPGGVPLAAGATRKLALAQAIDELLAIEALVEDEMNRPEGDTNAPTA
jgi:hypothetical protein